MIDFIKLIGVFLVGWKKAPNSTLSFCSLSGGNFFFTYSFRLRFVAPKFRFKKFIYFHLINCTRGVVDQWGLYSVDREGTGSCRFRVASPRTDKKGREEEAGVEKRIERPSDSTQRGWKTSMNWCVLVLVEGTSSTFKSPGRTGSLLAYGAEA